MNLEQMKKIVDGAPEWALTYNTATKQYSEGWIKTLGNVLISDLRTELAKHEPMDLRAVDIPHGTIVLEK